MVSDGFICPICRSIEYEEERKDNGVFGKGYHSYVTGYSCSGCGVMFRDPDKFTATRKKAVEDGQSRK